MDSAILPSYTSIGIHENHMGMTKYDSESHHGFISVIGETRRWTKDLKQPVTLMPPLRDRVPVCGPVTLNLPAKNDDFIGRVSILDQIEGLCRPKIWAITKVLECMDLEVLGKYNFEVSWQESRLILRIKKIPNKPPLCAKSQGGNMQTLISFGLMLALEKRSFKRTLRLLLVLALSHPTAWGSVTD